MHSQVSNDCNNIGMSSSFLLFVLFRVKELPHHPYPVQKDDLVQGLCEGVKLDVYFPGFPSLKYIPHSTRWEKTGVRVFQAASRDINCILAIIRHHHNFVSHRDIEQYLFNVCVCGA